MVMVAVSLLGPLASRFLSWSSRQLPVGSRSAEGVQPPEGAVGPRQALLCLRAGQDLGPLCCRVPCAIGLSLFQFYGYLSQQQNMMQDYVRTGTYQRAILQNHTDFKDKVSTPGAPQLDPGRWCSGPPCLPLALVPFPSGLSRCTVSSSVVLFFSAH